MGGKTSKESTVISSSWSEFCTFEDKNGRSTEYITHDAVSISVDMYYLSSRVPIKSLHDLGSVISRCKKLKSIQIIGHPFVRTFVKEDLLVSLFQAKGSYNFPLQHLSICKCFLYVRGFEAIIPFLKSRGELDRLSLANCDIGDGVAAAIGEVLDQTCIDNLDLNSNQISAKGLSNLFSSKNSVNLKSLNLQENSIGRAEVDEIARFLSKEGVALEWIAIGKKSFVFDDYFNPEWVEVLFRSLKSNTSLKRLHIVGDVDRAELTVESVRQLTTATMELICNVSSFGALCESNHTIEFTCTGFHPDDPSLLKALIINTKHDISTTQKLRYKLRWIYFQQNFEVNPFYSMKMVWIPYVMELMTITMDCVGTIEVEQPRAVDIFLSNEGDLSGMYHFLRQSDLSGLFPYRSK